MQRPSGLEGLRASRNRPDEETKSIEPTMEGASSEEQDPTEQPPRKRRFHRHTLRQIQEMEMVFKECPHPDEKQRLELSRELGLEPRQVKFWFQNRRTQMKSHQERAENSMLRAENERLRSENIAMREALKNATCPQCGGPATLGEMSYDEQQLLRENAHLKEELDRVSTFAAKYLARPGGQGLSIQPNIPVTSLEASGSGFGGQTSGTGLQQQAASLWDLATQQGGLTAVEKPLVAELAIIAMEELLAVAQAGEPLWSLQSGGGKEALNQDEYMQQFPRGLGPTPLGLKVEVTRDSGLVMMGGAALVETLMDAGGWLDMFSCIVSRALTTEVLSTGVGSNWNNALQLMYAEFQVLSPLVPTREVYFLRYCKQHAEDVWAIVDVSVDALRQAPPHLRCRLRPSGFLIQDMPNGYAKVTVLQHMEYDDRQVNNMYRGLVNSGAAFGARRWLATLQRQCERLAVFLGNNLSPREMGGIASLDGRRSMLKLAQRMTNNFCAGVSASTVHIWTTLSGSGEEDGVRVMTRKSVGNPGEPSGIVLSAATSLWLPANPQRVFEFLRDDRLRSEWDILANGGSVQEMARIPKGHDPGNVVSLLRVNASNTSQSNMLILQESCTDASGSLIVYAPVDIPHMETVLRGGEPAYVALLPSGFAILPDIRAMGAESSAATRNGCLLTVAFQILVSHVPTAKLNLESVNTVNSLIGCTVQRIKTTLGCE